jgi:hypothetical protein
MNLFIPLIMLVAVYLLLKEPLGQSLHSLQRNWLTYPKKTMSLCIVLANMIFVFTTIVESRTTKMYWYDDMCVIGILASVIVGFLVDVRPLS